MKIVIRSFFRAEVLKSSVEAERERERERKRKEKRKKEKERKKRKDRRVEQGSGEAGEEKRNESRQNKLEAVKLSGRR